ncbi:MAG: penicillin-binding protein [Deltaproteobacteria bacterium]|nr:MAG: penicillin-binding protein [Deltaproteobacteria bacterium]
MKPRYLTAVLFLFLAVGTGLGVAFVRMLIVDLPSIRALKDFRHPAVTRIYTYDRQLLREIYAERRTPVPYPTFPAHLVNALIVTEDRQFWEHSGIDLKGILRAIARDIQAGAFVEGASTLTQQLAKTLFLTPEKSLSRKFKEMFLAFQLERRYTKKEILELYLNQVYLGSGVYGVSAAAERFFGKPVHALDLHECALLAGLPKAPSYYSPLVHPEAAIRRRNIVLTLMRNQKMISEAAYDTAVTIPYMPPDRTTVSEVQPAAYFTDYVLSTLKPSLGDTLLYKGGLSIQTSLDLNCQKVAEAAVLKGVSRLKQRMASADLETAGVQAALVSIEISSGRILALIGGLDYARSPYNRATQARRQPGSAFKTFVFAYAIEQGLSQMAPVLDAPVSFSIPGNSNDWQPQNYSRDYKGIITLRTALSLSKNIPAVRLIDRYTPEAIIAFSKKLGITARLKPTLSLALGTSEMTLIDLTQAYGVFPNGGQRLNLTSVISIRKPDQTQIMPIQASPPHSDASWAVTPATAAIVCDMLTAVVQEGTGRQAKRIRRPVGGKTGTTNDCRDALFVGFSPDIVTGVWVGNDDHSPLGKGETGARAALPIWIDYMAQVLESRPYRHFPIPDSVELITVNPKTGKPVPAHTPRTINVLFATEAAP